MTDIVPNEQTYEDYDVVSSSSGPFTFNFQYFEKTDLDVTVDGVSLAQSGFTVTPGAAVQFGGYDGGSVTLVTAVSNARVVIARSTVTKRTSNLSGANLTADAVNTALNKLTMMLADNRRDLTRAILATYGNVGTAFNPADVAALAAKVTEIDELHAILDDLVILGALGTEIEALGAIPNAILAAAQAVTNPYGLNTRAEMTALTKADLPANGVYKVLDRTYVWDATSTVTADGVLYLAHDDGGDGRFVLQDGGVLQYIDGDTFDDVFDALTSTTSDDAAQLPDTNQSALFINPGLRSTDIELYEFTGQYQSIFGAGLGSILRRGGFLYNGHDFGYIADLSLLGDPDRTHHGVEFRGETASKSSSNGLVARVRIRDHDYGISHNASDTGWVSNQMVSDVIANSNNIGYYGREAYDSIISNSKFRANLVNNVRLDGGGQYKFVGCDMSSVTDGKSVAINGTAQSPFVESYFIGCNITHGSQTESVTVTSITSYTPAGGAAGSMIKVTTATDHFVLPGFQEVELSGTTDYDGDDQVVADVLSPTEFVIARSYSGTDRTGTYKRRYAGFDLNADLTDANTVYDVFVNGGHINIFRSRGRIRNIVMTGVRAGGAKSLGFFETDPESMLFLGSMAGRTGSTPASSSAPNRSNSTSDNYYGGSAVGHVYACMFNSLDPHGSGRALDDLHFAIKMPHQASGLANNNWPAMYGFVGVWNDGPRIGLGELYFEFRRSGPTGDLILEANGLEVVSGVNDVNKVSISGANTSAVPLIAASGTDTNVNLHLKPKGSSAVRILSGNNTRQIQVNDTGLGFYNTTPVAKPSVTGSTTDEVNTSLLAALVSLGLVTDATT
jgi:hypothetical protein